MATGPTDGGGGMGQLLIVQGRDPQAVAAVHERARAGLAELGQATGTRALTTRGTIVLAVPRRHAPGQPALQDHVTSEWAASVGAWLHDGRRGDQALARAAAALRAGADEFSQVAPALDGFFVLAAGDGTGSELALATDRTGTLHAYRAKVDGCTVISTSALALARLAGADLAPLAVREFLAAGSVFEQRSLFAGVDKLPPASRLVWREGRLVERERWWRLRPLLHGSTEAEARPGDVESLAESLVGVLDRVLDNWPGSVLDLTGGFDSRGVLAAALVTGRPFRTVVAGADDDPDVRAAAGIAEAFDLDHHRLRPGSEYGRRGLDDLADALALCDGECELLSYADVAQLQATMAGRVAREGMTVNGSSGELCRGYWWDLLGRVRHGEQPLDARRTAAGRFATDGWADEMTAGHHEDRAVDHFTGVVERALHGLEDLPGTAQADVAYLMIRMHRWAGRLVSSTDRLWPCLSPFMFEGPMREALSAPPALRQHSRMARQLIERLHPELAALPMAGGYPALPIRLGTAHRFGPLAAEVAGKAWKRVRAKGGQEAEGGPSSVAGLWADEALAELLQPRRMRTAALYDEEALAGFLSDSRQEGFTATDRFGRVLTLELAARAAAGR
jgi:asparagine synthase (glutamine-hydrolysing)